MHISDIWSNVLWISSWFILIYMVVVIGFYTVMLVLSFVQLRKEYKLEKHEVYDDFLQAVYTKPVSIIVPAYNEAAGIIESVRSLLSLRYPQFEVIVVNDGSTDQTADRMIEHFQMRTVNKVIREQIQTKRINRIYQSTIIPHLFLVEKENGGKADALNTGLNVSRYPYFCSIDGDSILESDSLLKVMKPIIQSNEEVIASGGSVRIANGCDIQMGSVLGIGLSHKPLVIMQVIEYLRAFLMGRMGLSRLNMVLILSGAFSVFSKKWVIEAGGYSTKTVGEDMELVVRLHRMLRERRLKKKIVFVPDPVCWTEAPETLRFLGRQRSRWQRGLLESLWTHKKMMLNPKYGLVGTVAFPYFWIIELLGPVVELGGYLFILFSLLFGGIYLEFALLLFLLFVLYGSIFSMMAVLLEAWSLNKYPKLRDLSRLYIHSMLEIFWYRPLTIIWRCGGMLQHVLNDRRWGDMNRKGISRGEVEL